MRSEAPGLFGEQRDRKKSLFGNKLERCSNGSDSESDEEERRDSVLMEGKLKLKGSVLLPSKGVYVKLFNHLELRVYDSRLTNALESVVFDSLTKITCKKNRIKVIHGKKVLQFKAKSSQEAASWSTAINELILVKIVCAGRKKSRSFN